MSRFFTGDSVLWKHLQNCHRFLGDIQSFGTILTMSPFVTGVSVLWNHLKDVTFCDGRFTRNKFPPTAWLVRSYCFIKCGILQLRLNKSYYVWQKHMFHYVVALRFTYFYSVFVLLSCVKDRKFILQTISASLMELSRMNHYKYTDTFH